MKLKLKAVLAILVTITIFYSACKKEVKFNKPPVTVNAGMDTLAPATAQILRNLTQTISGTYGGVDITKGVFLPDFTTLHNARPLIFALPQLCSFFPDTLINYKTNIADTITAQTSGLFKFYFSCDTLKEHNAQGYPVYSDVTGYAAYDSLATTGQTPRGLFVYNVKAFYAAKAMDPEQPLSINGKSNKLINFNGSVKSFVDTASTKKTLTPSSVHGYYTLSNVVVDLSKGVDFTSGTTTFAAVGEFNGIKWYYEGVIKFLGGHKASVTIKNKIYNIDLLTGKVTTV